MVNINCDFLNPDVLLSPYMEMLTFLSCPQSGTMGISRDLVYFLIQPLPK